jgi:hypothetical protein
MRQSKFLDCEEMIKLEEKNDIMLLQVDFYNILGIPSQRDAEGLDGNYVSGLDDEYTPLKLSAMLHGFDENVDPNNHLQFLRAQPIPARSIRLPLGDGLTLGWAPNGYGKTFVFEHLLGSIFPGNGFMQYFDLAKASIQSTSNLTQPFLGLGLLIQLGSKLTSVIVFPPRYDPSSETFAVSAYQREHLDSVNSENWVFSLSGLWDEVEIDDGRIRSSTPQSLAEEALLAFLSLDVNYVEIPKASSRNFSHFLEEFAANLDFAELPNHQLNQSEWVARNARIFGPQLSSTVLQLTNQLMAYEKINDEQRHQLSTLVHSLVQGLLSQSGEYSLQNVLRLVEPMIPLQFHHELPNHDVIGNIMDDLILELRHYVRFPERPEHIVLHDLSQLFTIHQLYARFAWLLSHSNHEAKMVQTSLKSFFTMLSNGLNADEVYTKYRSAVLLPYLWPGIHDLCLRVGVDIPETMTQFSSEEVVRGILDVSHTLVPIGDLFEIPGAMIEREGETGARFRTFMTRFGADSEKVEIDRFEAKFAFTPEDATRNSSYLFFRQITKEQNRSMGGQSHPSPYHRSLWPTLYPSPSFPLANMLAQVNQNLNEDTNPWGVVCETATIEGSNAGRFIFRPKGRRGDEIQPDILSFGMRSEVVLQMALAKFLYDSTSDLKGASRSLLILDESEVGRSEYWTSLLIDRLNQLQLEVKGLSGISILVVSHRGLVLEEARDDGEYEVLHPVVYRRGDEEEE